MSGRKTEPLTDRELLIAEFAYRCCEKGDNIQQMEYLLRKIFEPAAPDSQPAKEKP